MERTWIAAAAVDDLIDNDVTGIDVDGHALAFYRVNSEVFATDSVCTHGNADLCDGFFEDYQIECPLHQGRFDVHSGKALCAPLTENIRTYPIKIEDGRVYIAL